MQKQLECKTEEKRGNWKINVVLTRYYVRIMLNNVLKFLGLVFVTDVAAQSQNFSQKKLQADVCFFTKTAPETQDERAHL